MTDFNLLTIAGSDSGGGAGIQADIKTTTALKGFATTVITALTAQNTHSVTAIHPAPITFIKAQLKAILLDIQIDVIKSGMLYNAEIIELIADLLPKNIPYILDTVMISTGGDRLLDQDATEIMKAKLFPKALMITPNLHELAVLAGGITIDHAQALIHNFGCEYVLIKGGHDDGTLAKDILVSKDENFEFSLPRIQTQAGHGTGCTLSAAIACYIAKGLTPQNAVQNAKNYVHQALFKAKAIGTGHYPLNHCI